MELISLSLGLPANRMNGFFEDDHTSFMRLNHYPPCPIPHLALGVGRHKDAGALTVLAQDDVGGLEVKRKIDGQWILVKPTPDAYIINAGDIIQVTSFCDSFSSSFYPQEHQSIYDWICWCLQILHIQVWSNDKYESVEHRVMVNSERERFSIPFFFNPAHYTWVEPLEELINERNPPKYKAYNWGKFFSTKKRSNFKKLEVENIEICHFKN